MKRILFLTLAILCCLSLTGCFCKHQWVDATCTSPQRCALCNKTNGQPIEHTWSPATCQKPKTCTICGTTEGVILSHSWTPASCSKPKTCSVCGVTDGEKLPHTTSDEWVTKKTDYIYAETVKVKTCTACGEEIEQEITDISELHDGAFFLISANDFVTRLDYVLNSYAENRYSAENGSSGDNFACIVHDNYNKVCAFMFAKNNDSVKKSNRDDTCGFNKVIGLCDYESLPRITVALIQASDPSLSFAEAKEYAQEVLRSESKTINGIKYLVMESVGQYYVGLTIE